jgi:hypothetical protein
MKYFTETPLQFLILKILKNKPEVKMFNNKLKNKVVLLTGVAQGIGKSIAIEIASEGGSCYLN